jgi:hypothetical protein
MKKKSTLSPKLQFLLPIPEATHVAKCLKGQLCQLVLVQRWRTLQPVESPDIVQ